MNTAGIVAAVLLTAATCAAGRPIVAVCAVGIQSGSFDCYETAFSAPDYIDCAGPDVARSGAFGMSQSGVLIWGNVVAGNFEPAGQATYEWTGRQSQTGGVDFALLGVDEDRVFGDGMDRTCVSGAFR